jgi:hypothetical protein
VSRANVPAAVIFTKDTEPNESPEREVRLVFTGWDEVFAELSPVLLPETVVVPVMASVGVAEPERVTPLTEVGVIAPKPTVNLGVVVVFVQVAVTPLLAAVVSTEVTVPVEAAVQEVTPAPSVVKTLVLAPLVEGSWKTIPEPAIVFTLMIPDPLVAPFKVNCPPVPPLVPDDNTPEAEREVPVAAPMSGVVKVIPARVKGAVARLIAT